MDESILVSIKKLIGFDSDFDVYDKDLIMLINGCFATLYQLGVGPRDAAYKITSEADVWSEFIGENYNIESVKTYIYIKCRLVFDPPANSFITTALSDQAKELEWRLNVESDPGWKEETVTEEEDDGL